VAKKAPLKNSREKRRERSENMTTEETDDRAKRLPDRSWPGLWMWPDDAFLRTARGFWPRPSTRGLLGTEQWLPDMDVFEREGKIVVRLDVPGMKREDFQVDVEDGILSVHGHRSEEKEIKKEHYHCSERTTGSFSRAINLGRDVDPEHIEATYENGVLEVVVPRPEVERKKSVSVKVK
jgi:HSP20 family protein